MQKMLFFISFLFIQNTFGQVTFVIESLPNDTSKNASIFISGDFEGWTGGQEKYKLTQNENAYSIIIPRQDNDIDFKFTLGSWDSVEVDTEGNSIDNRFYSFGENEEVVELTIANWIKPAARKETASENVSILSTDFVIPQLNRERIIWLYLPPDYKTSDKNYPVIYMHDGQNLFDDATSSFGEWQVDETLDKLFKENGFGAIVIAVDNGETKRLDEYSPWENSKYGGGEGEAYIEFIVKTLKPFVDKNYRTELGKENTAIIGSSMGGLISHYTGLKYPEVFGKVGVYSAAFWFAPEVYDYTRNHGNIQDSRMYFLAGGLEGVNNVDFSEISETVKIMNEIVGLQVDQGFPKENTFVKVVPDGKHNEKLWRENFEETILWLFNK